jgi:RNase P subunit RPR2
MTTEMKVVSYQCKQCQTIIKVRLFPEESPAVALNCNNCGAGQGMPMQDQQRQGKGLFPIAANA